MGMIIYPTINTMTFDDDYPHDIPTALANIPQVFGECASLPCDDANINLGEPNYRFVFLALS